MFKNERNLETKANLENRDLRKSKFDFGEHGNKAFYF